jgi:hypothetical protein
MFVLTFPKALKLTLASYCWLQSYAGVYIRMVEWWIVGWGMVKLWNGEWLNCGMGNDCIVEWWNSGVVEWCEWKLDSIRSGHFVRQFHWCHAVSSGELMSFNLTLKNAQNNDFLQFILGGTHSNISLAGIQLGFFPSECHYCKVFNLYGRTRF